MSHIQSKLTVAIVDIESDAFTAEVRASLGRLVDEVDLVIVSSGEVSDELVDRSIRMQITMSGVENPYPAIDPERFAKAMAANLKIDAYISAISENPTQVRRKEEVIKRKPLNPQPRPNINKQMRINLRRRR